MSAFMVGKKKSNTQTIKPSIKPPFNDTWTKIDSQIIISKKASITAMLITFALHLSYSCDTICFDGNPDAGFDCL